MKKYFWIGLLAIIACKSALAQCTTNQLPFQTNGADWILVNNNVGYPNNIPANVIPAMNITGVYWWDSAAPGSWISCLNTGLHPTNGIGPNQSMTFRYTYKACGTDSLIISMFVFRDNFCNVYLDGNLVFSDPQVTPTNQINLNVGTNLSFTIPNSGTTPTLHTIDFEIIEFNVSYSQNGWGGKMSGTITSQNSNNSIVYNTANCANYSCCTSLTQLQIVGDTLLCQGESSTLTANGAISYSWSGSITNGMPITPSATAIYTVTGVDANGCTATSSITIHVNPLPIITANAAPQSVCTGNPTTLTGSGALSYAWSGGISNGIPFIPTVSSTYTVTGTDANGCTSTSSVSISTGNSLAINISPQDPVLCLGDSIQLTASGGTLYSWTPNTDINAVNISSPLVFPSSTTTYYVTGSDATGCTGTSSVTIQIITDPKILVSKSGDVECNIHTIQLSAMGATSYIWSPASLLSSPNAAVTNATVTTPTMFIVTGTVGSCIVTDSILVNIYKDDETDIYIPNAFTPNGDGKNDCLRVVNSAKFISYYFAIYNRWGQRVFESDNPNDCWDGNFKNQKAQESTYYYFLKAETRCGKIFKKGDITVIY